MDGIGVVLILVLVFGPFMAMGYGVGWAVRGRRDRRSLALGIARYKRQDALIDQIQRDAYEHMVLDPSAPLPVIIIDSIRNSEAEERREIEAARIQPMTADPSALEAATRPFIDPRVTRPDDVAGTARTYPPDVRASDLRP